MKHFFTLLSLLTVLGLSAKEVPKHLAERVAKNFFKNTYNRSTVELNLVYQENLSDGKPAYYVFDVINNNGFVIISGDDIAEPVLAYSDETMFNKENQRHPAVSWLQYFKNQIALAISEGVKQSDDFKDKWNNYANNNFTINARGNVQPLCKAKWGQDPYENAKCPFDKDANKNAVTGCPATAMAIIMKYHNHPSQGTGQSSYKHDKYGTLSVNYGSEMYDYSKMPDLITEATQEEIKGECAKLMYHCGVAVEMGYTPNESGSFVIEAYCSKKEATCEDAYKNYFGYDKTTIKGLEKKNFSDTDWINMMKAELDAMRPMQYAGFGGGGHTWVCDGYDESNKFHMNWGWAGSNDGFYALTALTPGAGGTGSGSGSYNNGQQAIMGLKPALAQLSSAPKFGLVLNSSITSDVPKLRMNQPFTTTVKLNYTGSSALVVDLAAIILTEDGEFVDYVDYLENQTLTDGTNKDFTFSSPGIGLIPGKYKIGIFSAGLQDSLWTLINQKSFKNPLEIESEGNPNDISLASAITLPTEVLLEKTAFKFSADVINTSTSQYEGFVQFALYDVNGEVYYFADESLDIPLTLNAGATQKLTFDVPVTANLLQGTYLLALLNRKDTIFDFISNGQFSNFVDIVVRSTPLIADSYENNDTPETAFKMTPNFVNDNAKISTTGSNMHTTFDLDHYIIDLPAGFEYTIMARVEDQRESKDGKSYSVDVVFNYILNGTPSEYFSSELPSGGILANGNGKIIFRIAPSFVGFDGTYLLNVDITRKEVSSTNEFDANNILIYPNPANDFLTVDHTKSNLNIVGCQIYNALGQQIFNEKFDSTSSNHIINTSSFNNGIYFLKIIDDKNKSYNSQFQILK